MLKLPNIAQQTAYSLTREMYLAGCELHIQTLVANTRALSMAHLIHSVCPQASNSP